MMGCTWGCCASIVEADDGASVEYFPEELAPVAREVCASVKDALDYRFRTRIQSMYGIWRKVAVYGHSTVEAPQDLDGPTSDLRADEIWVVVPAEFLIAQYFPSLQTKMQLRDEGATFIVWRALRMGTKWHVRYAGGALVPGQDGNGMQFKPEMCERVVQVQDGSGAELAASAAAIVTRYHAMCCTVVDEMDGRRGFNG